MSADPPAAPPPAARRPALALLGHHDFRLLLVMQMSAGVRMPMLFFTQAWYVNTVAPESQRVLLLGLLGASRGVVFLGYAIFGGAIADRFPRRTTLLSSHVVAFVVAVGIGLLLRVPAVGAGDGPWLWILIALFASFGLIDGQDLPTRTAMIRDAVPAGVVTTAITVHQLALSVTFLPTAPFVGWALEAWGFSTAYLIAASGHIVVIACALRLRLPDLPADPMARASSVLSNIGEGLVVLRDNAAVRWTVWLTWLVTAAGISVMGILVPAWVRDVLALDAAGWGLMALCWGIGQLISMIWLLLRGEYGRMGMTFLVAALGMGLAVTAFGLSRTIPPAFLFNGLAGMFHAVVLAVSTAIVQRIVPNRFLGRVTALLLLAGGIMQVVALGVGAIAQVVGLEIVYPLAGLTIVLATLLVGARQRPLRTLA